MLNKFLINYNNLNYKHYLLCIHLTEGGLNLSPDRELCTVTLENNEVYIINGGLGGNIMELNENLLKNPNWLLEYVKKITKI